MNVVEQTNNEIRWFVYRGKELEYIRVDIFNKDIEKIVNESIRFRKAIEDTDFCKLFPKDQFCKFPKACCGDTSMLLWKYLEDRLGVSFVKKSGCYKTEKIHHAWLEFAGSLSIDITADQFKDCDEKVIATTDRDWLNKFSSISSFEENDFDKMPKIVGERLRKLYEAICSSIT